MLPPTEQDLKAARISATCSSAKTGVPLNEALALPHAFNVNGLVVKFALRAPDCRWWSFGKKRFAGPSRKAADAKTRRLARKACTEAPSWKEARGTWSASASNASLALGATLPAGRYALRVP